MEPASTDKKKGIATVPTRRPENDRRPAPLPDEISADRGEAPSFASLFPRDSR